MVDSAEPEGRLSMVMVQDLLTSHCAQETIA